MLKKIFFEKIHYNVEILFVRNRDQLNVFLSFEINLGNTSQNLDKLLFKILVYLLSKILFLPSLYTTVSDN